MNPKSGIWTTEHFAAVVSQVLTLLALFGFISQNDTQTLEEAVTKGIAAVFIFIANAAVVVHYIKSRLHLKSGVGRVENPSYGVGRIDNPSYGQAAGAAANEGKDSQVPKLINSGLILLAVLTMFAGPVQAQYALPFRNNHEQRLKALEQKIVQQQAAPAPQQAPVPTPQPIIIQVPSQPAPQPAPPQIVYPYPAQPPLQTYPIQGQPLQAFPIQGSPQQAFPIQGQPLQTFPIGGAPKQAFPLAPPAQPQQSNPAAPPGPAQPNPTPAPAPAPPGAPLQTFPIAPPSPAPQAPAPNAPAPSSGPVPYASRFVRALYSDQRSAISVQPNRLAER